jgi:hypothetical protein
MPLTVTFDTNTLASVVSPETAQRGTGTSGTIVRTAIQETRIQGFFSGILIALEGIDHEDRAEVLGKTKVASQISSPDKHTINIAIGARHFRKPLNSQFSARVEGAIALGMRVLEVVSTMGIGSSLSRELPDFRADWRNMCSHTVQGERPELGS